MAETMTIEQFNKLFILDPEANKNQTFSYVQRHLNSSMTTFSGEKMDFDFIYSKYKSYRDWWHRKHGSKDPKFLAKADKQKSIIAFIADGMYDSEWGIGKSFRDYYMLGDMSFEEFTKLSDRFEDLLSLRDPEAIMKAKKSFKTQTHERETDVDKAVQSQIKF